jgi:hypothetical protein
VRAYIGSKPIDEWAAEFLWGSQVDKSALWELRAGAFATHGLSTALKRFVDALNRHFSDSAPAGLQSRVHAVAVGWRVQGRRLRRCLLVISNLDSGLLVTVRAKARRRQLFGVVMVDPLDALGGPGWVPMGRFRQLNDALTPDLSHDAREDLMIGLLRELSHEGAPIGPDAMCIRIPRRQPKPVIRFAPEQPPSRLFHREGDAKTEVMPVAYTPIIVTPNLVQFPALTTGLAMDRLAGFEVEWRLPPLSPTVLLQDRQTRGRSRRRA